MKSKRNELINVSIPIPNTLTDCAIKEIIETTLHSVSHIYSYIIYKKPAGWRVEILISKTKGHNTISVTFASNEIVTKIRNTNSALTTKNVVGYRQPPIEILIEVFQPLIYNLSIQQNTYWRTFEVDDLTQICALVIVNLYNKGYYIHKNLIKRSFINEVLMQLRSEKNKPVIVSYDALLNDSNINISETIEDYSALQAIEDIIDNSSKTIHEQIISKELEIVKKYVSPRVYDQLLREYSTNNTTPTGRGTVHKLKTKMKIMGISYNTLYNQIVNDEINN